MIFQHGREPVLIQRILIGFKAMVEKKTNPTWKSWFRCKELVIHRRTFEAAVFARLKPAVTITTKIVKAIFHKATFHKTVAVITVIVEIWRRETAVKRLFRLFHWLNDGEHGLAEAGDRLGRREIRRRWRQLWALRVAGLYPAIMAVKIVVVVYVDKWQEAGLAMV